MIDNDTLPNSDDGQAQGPSEQDLLDAVMKNSPIMDEVGIPLPTEEDNAQDPVESDIEDPEESDEVVSEDSEEGTEETEEDIESADDASTQPEIFTAEDLDLDAQVQVKIDGKEMNVSFGDLLKGYQTDAHLSKKGRELGEAQKGFETAQAEKLQELETVATASAQMLAGTEQKHAKAYHDIEAKINKAREDGDTYEVGELKDKREQVQKKYWDARKQRESIVGAVQAKKAEYETAEWNKKLEHFSKEIPNHIPDFNDKVANDIRDFAVGEGLSDEVLQGLVDPVAIKMINDYRLLKQGVSKGAAKRRVIPAKKAIPTKKAPPASKKAADKANMVKARAFKENASADDQMDFLRQHASKSLNL